MKRLSFSIITLMMISTMVKAQTFGAREQKATVTGAAIAGSVVMGHKFNKSRYHPKMIIEGNEQHLSSPYLKKSLPSGGRLEVTYGKKGVFSLNKRTIMPNNDEVLQQLERLQMNDVRIKKIIARDASKDFMQESLERKPLLAAGSILLAIGGVVGTLSLIEGSEKAEQDNSNRAVVEKVSQSKKVKKSDTSKVQKDI